MLQEAFRPLGGEWVLLLLPARGPESALESVRVDNPCPLERRKPNPTTDPAISCMSTRSPGRSTVHEKLARNNMVWHE